MIERDLDNIGTGIIPEQSESINNNINNTSSVMSDINTTGDNDKYKGHEHLRELNAVFSTERAKEIGSLGGKATAESRKRKRTFQEQARALLDMRCSQESAQNVLGDDAQRFFPDGQATNGEILLARMMLEGWQGNTKAAEFTRDTAGYKPTQEISVEGMDDAARALLANVAKRLEQADKKSKKD